MTLYALRVPADGNSIDDAEVVDRSRYGWEFLDQAIALWRLVNPARADAIEAIRDRASAASEEYTLFGTDTLTAFVELIGDVDKAIVEAGIVDEHWRVPPSQLHELADRVPGMDLKTERSLKNKTLALGEVMMNAVSLRNFFADALREGCVVEHS
jgi:hypothetical protein